MVERRHHVVVVGAGFGGLAAARVMADLPVDITVVDARNHHTFQPLLYQVATAGLDVDDVCYAVRGVFHRQRNVRVRLGRVTGVDPATRVVTLDGGSDALGYDSLILACGAVTNTFGVPGVDRFGFGLKSAADAVALRDHVLGRFEAADARPELIDDGALTVAIVGAGPTGVEMAGGTAELVHRVLRRDFPALDVGRTRIVLIEAAERVLGTFDERLAGKARRSLEKLGVEVMTGAAVESVDARGVHFGDGSTLPTQTLVWAAGVKANPIAAASGLPTGPGGRILVGDDLAVGAHPDVFVIGDLAASPTPDDRPLPQVAPVAIQGGRHVAAVIGARIGETDPPGPFVYRDKGSMATIGRHAAVAELPNGMRFSGPLGWLAWLALHLVMLIGFRNRANVLVNWAWNYVTYDRGSRVVIGRQAVASTPT
ncbi:MAG: NAD(P)/FAD-dependent oxidoreductase [Acidimicrobiales bacterium]|nr:NAD(P)/FAD-dependent oxidoreductase [Acidimicrobiales bacterium]